MLKTIGLLLLILTGIGGGAAASAELNRRAGFLDTACRLIGWLAVRIRYTAAPIGEVLSQAADNGEFSRLSFLPEAVRRLEEGSSPEEAWGSALTPEKTVGLRESDREILKNFGRELGRSDVEGQLAHCEAFEAILKEQARAARAEAVSKGKLYLTLGVAGGLCVALILL